MRAKTGAHSKGDVISTFAREGGFDVRFTLMEVDSFIVDATEEIIESEI